MKPTIRKSGFTLIELLVVICIIAVLASMTMVVIGLLKNKERRFSTSNLMTHIGSAVITYLDKWPTFGDTKPDDFRKEPYQYLVYRMSKTVSGQPIDIPMKNLLKVDGSSVQIPEILKDATHITDTWGQMRDSILNWSIMEQANGGRRYMVAMEIRSSAGTPGNPKDDIIYRLVKTYNTDVQSSSGGELVYSGSDVGRFVFAAKTYGDWIDPLDFSNNSLDSKDLEAALQSK